jgi:flagellar assembly protein FliH
MAPMAVVRPYLFERRFDLGSAANAPAPASEVSVREAIPPKLYDDADLERARAEGLALGLADGRATGRAEAHAEAEASDRQRLVRTLDAIAKALDRLARAADAVQAAAQCDGIEIALAVARKVLPEYCRRHAATEIAGVLRQVLGQLRDEPRLIIRAAAAGSAELRAQLQPVVEAAGFTGEFAVVSDAAIADGDCRIEWSSGGAERETALMWQRIDALVERALADGGGAAKLAAGASTNTI